MLMIDPEPCADMVGATARIPRNEPVRLTSTTRRKSSTDVSRSGAARKTPALLMRTSTRPCVSSAQLVTASQSASLVTSWRRELALSPTSSATRPTPSASASVSSSAAPSPAIVCAAHAPIPPAAPVISATFPLNRAIDMTTPCISRSRQPPRPGALTERWTPDGVSRLGAGDRGRQRGRAREGLIDDAIALGQALERRELVLLGVRLELEGQANG